jgi:hypothetical protein
MINIRLGIIIHMLEKRKKKTPSPHKKKENKKDRFLKLKEYRNI